MSRSRLIPILVAVAVGSAPMPAAAQAAIGVTAGVNLATVAGDQSGDPDSRTALRLGAFADFPLGLVLTFHPEVAYSQRGAEYVADGGGSATAKLDYLEMPLLFRVGVPGSRSGLHGLVGPVLSFELSCGGTVGCSERGTKSFIVGGQIGAGIDLPLPLFRLGIDGRYTLGLESFSDDESDVKHRVWSINLSAGFPLGAGM